MKIRFVSPHHVPHLLSWRSRGSRLVFRERKLPWAFTSSLAAGMLLFSPYADDGGVFLAGTGVVVGAFSAYMLWRFAELELDLKRHRWTLRRGRGRKQVEEEGSLDGSAYVVFDVEIVRHESEEGTVKHRSWYTVEIDIRGGPRRVVVGRGKNEVRLRREAERMARTLGATLVDESISGRARQIEVSDLDRSVADRGAEGGVTPAGQQPPPDRGLRVRTSGAREILTLPSPHSIVHTLAGTAMPVFFLYIGSKVLALPMIRPGPHWILPAVVVVFWCVPTVWNREWIRFGDRTLLGGANVLGLTVPTWTLTNHEIEDVDQVPFTSWGRKYSAVRLRSDDRVVYIGRHLSPEGREWLMGRIRAHLVR